MKKLLAILTFLMAFALFSCKKDGKESKEVLKERENYQMLVEAEERSGLLNFNNTIVTENKDLNLPKEYKGVTFNYASRNKNVISDEGVVTQPNTWWLQSRNQQGEVIEEFLELNKNWPIVIDVTMTYENQVRKAKILIIVVPHDDAVAPEYKG